MSEEDIARYSKLVALEMAFRTIYFIDDHFADNEGDINSDPDLTWNLAVIRDDHILEEFVGLDAPSLAEHEPSGRDTEPKS